MDRTDERVRSVFFCLLSAVDFHVTVVGSVS